MSHRRITRLCPEGWYFLFVVTFIIGGAVLGQVNLLVVLAGLMVGPLLFNWRLVQLILVLVAACVVGALGYRAVVRRPLQTAVGDPEPGP